MATTSIMSGFASPTPSIGLDPLPEKSDSFIGAAPAMFINIMLNSTSQNILRISMIANTIHGYIIVANRRYTMVAKGVKGWMVLNTIRSNKNHMADDEKIKDTGRYYATVNPETGAISAKIQLSNKIAQRLKFKNRQKVYITYNEETEEIYIRAL